MPVGAARSAAKSAKEFVTTELPILSFRDTQSLAQAIGFEMNLPPSAGTVCQGAEARWGLPDDG